MGIRAAATLGALLSMGLVYGISRQREGMEQGRMLLIGTAVCFTFTGLSLFVQYLADFTGSFRMMRWLMGSLDGSSLQAAGELLVILSVGTVVIASTARALDLLCVG
jgi:iron complex transport system permease protein